MALHASYTVNDVQRFLWHQLALARCEFYVETIF